MTTREWIHTDGKALAKRIQQVVSGAVKSSSAYKKVARLWPKAGGLPLLLLLSLQVFFLSARAQSALKTKGQLRPGQPSIEEALEKGLQVRYIIYARYEPTGAAGTIRPHQLDVMERIQMVNMGARPVRNLMLRLYPNGYSSDSTRLAEDLLKQRDTRLYFAGPDQLGGISGLNISLQGKSGIHNQASLQLSDLTTSGTKELLMLTLPAPLLPGDSILLETPFTLRLPQRIKDLGYTDGVSYLKDWFIQIEKTGDRLAQAEIHLMIPSEAALYLDGQKLEPTGNGELNRSAGNQGSYHFTMDPHGALALLQQGGSLENGGITAGPNFNPDLNRNRNKDQDQDQDAAAYTTDPGQFFERLLPGPLKGKRPARPDSLWAEMTAARIGAYSSGPKPLKPAFLFNARQADIYRYLSFSPALGYNDYDKWMPGVLIHNYGLPSAAFNFLLAPLYSTHDHTLSGLGKLSYTARRPFDKWQISVTASRYGFNAYSDFSDGTGAMIKGADMRLLRIVPSLRYKWMPDHHDSDKTWSLSARAYILNKDSWFASEDQLSIHKTTTTIGELSGGFNNDRVLYPYAVNAVLQGTDQFLRLAVRGDYFLNYDASGAGLALRGYAGKFFYLEDKNIQSSYNLQNYFFNLSGSAGKEDFTYNDYFIGRSAYQGWMSQQMTTGGGFFKVSTPYLSDPVGQTDDWLAAINLTSDIPAGINPFSVLPFKMPVRVFLDLGTYSGLWSENPAAGRFLYDAGLQVSVLKEAVTIYMPVLYSKIYKDTYKSMGDLGGFAQRLRFSINLERLLPKRLQPDLNW